MLMVKFYKYHFTNMWVGRNNMAYESEESEMTKLSKFNSAALISLRLHNLWQDVNNHSRKGAYAMWNADLDRLWCELAADVIPTAKGEGDNDKIIKAYEEIKKRVKAHAPITNWKTSLGFEGIAEHQQASQAKQYEILIEKEIFLRRLQNKQGKGTAYLEEDDDWE